MRHVVVVHLGNYNNEGKLEEKLGFYFMIKQQQCCRYEITNFLHFYDSYFSGSPPPMFWHMKPLCCMTQKKKYTNVEEKQKTPISRGSFRSLVVVVVWTAARVFYNHSMLLFSNTFSPMRFEETHSIVYFILKMKLNMQKKKTKQFKIVDQTQKEIFNTWKVSLQ